MKKKIFIIVFFCLLCLPSLGMLFFKTDVSVEQRQVQIFPSIKTGGKLNVKFFDQLNDYFSDNFAFRQNLIEADAIIKKNVFRQSGNEKVIVGSKGYLFFSETLDDYLGQNTLSKREIYSCGRVLSLLQENVEQNNRQFLFVIAPNKNSLYPEYMPKRYIKISDNNNYRLLQAEMKKEHINTVDLKKMFIDSGKEVYHKLDSHWNNQGAAMGCNAILNYLGKDHYDYTNERYTIKKNFSGDLYGMLFPKGNKKDTNVIYNKKSSYKVTSNNKKVTDISIETESKDKKESIVMYRDSFGNALIPFVADEFHNGYFTKAVPYNWNLQNEKKADKVVIELVERHIHSLIEEAPYMAAPLRAGNLNTMEVNSNTTAEIGDDEEYVPISGKVDSKYIDDDSKIYVRLKSEDNEYTYEAFPAPIDVTSKNEGYDYGMYLDTSQVEAGTYDIDVITRKDNKYYSSGVKTSLELEE